MQSWLHNSSFIIYYWKLLLLMLGSHHTICIKVINESLATTSFFSHTNLQTAAAAAGVKPMSSIILAGHHEESLLKLTRSNRRLWPSGHFLWFNMRIVFSYHLHRYKIIWAHVLLNLTSMMVNLTHYLVMLLHDALSYALFWTLFLISSNWIPIVRMLMIFDDAQIRQLVSIQKNIR